MEEKFKESLLEKSGERKKSLNYGKPLKDPTKKDTVCFPNVFIDEEGKYEQRSVVKKENILK
jgi:hypothetical protein